MPGHHFECGWKLIMRKFFANLFILVFTACTPLPDINTPPPSASTPLPSFDREAETYQVYLTILESYCGETGLVTLDSRAPSHIGDELEYSSLKESFNIQDSRAEFQRSTYEDYVRADDVEPFVINPDYDFGRPVDFISIEEFNALVDEKGGISDFLTAYPRHCGYIGLSRVGFNDKGTQAMLYFELVDDGEDFCFGDYVLLRKVRNEWLVSAKAGDYIC
jgi:hypothetical protein